MLKREKALERMLSAMTEDELLRFMESVLPDLREYHQQHLANHLDAHAEAFGRSQQGAVHARFSRPRIIRPN